MADERRPDDGNPDSEPEQPWERRSGEERRKAERRTLDVLVDKDRRSRWDRRQGERRED